MASLCRNLLPTSAVLSRVLWWIFAIGFSAVDAVAAVPRPSSVRMFGVDYVDVAEFGRRSALSASWIKPQQSMRLKNKFITLEVALHSIEAQLNGLTIFLGEPVVLRAGRLYVGANDAKNLLTPLLAMNAPGRPGTVKTVVVDAGHGGDDPGNQNRRLGLTEKTYALDVARRLQQLLTAQGFNVVMTRKDDRAVELDDRAALSRKVRADLFISIHFNAVTHSAVAGTETYVMTPQYQRSSPQAERDQQMIRTRYASNSYDGWNAILGYQMHRSLVSGLKSEDRGLKRFRYSVLRSVACPAVLVEAAFLSNDGEGRKVATAAYRQRIAESIALGVRQHAGLRAPAKTKRG